MTLINYENQETLVNSLQKKNYIISACESCTGGMFISSIIDVSGSSNVVNESYVTYSNEAKSRILGVSSKTLETHGAVSFETAFEMAEGLYKKIDTNIAVSITGIAGPNGGTPQKPVGLVYYGICINGLTKVFKIHNSGSRSEVREKTVNAVINHVLNLLKEE